MAYPFRPIKKGKGKILRIEPRLHDPRDKAMPMVKALNPKKAPALIRNRSNPQSKQPSLVSIPIAQEGKES